MNTQDTRWQQRFSSYKKALGQLREAVDLNAQRPLSRLEKQGVIQAFEFCHELAWNTLKDFLRYQGNQDVSGSRDATREAFKIGLITDGEQWMSMIQSRNLSSHTYNEQVSEQLVKAILANYFLLFVDLQAVLEQRL